MFFGKEENVFSVRFIPGLRPETEALVPSAVGDLYLMTPNM